MAAASGPHGRSSTLRSMSTPVIALDHPAAIDAARVGHEAAALAVARAAGLPVVRRCGAHGGLGHPRPADGRPGVADHVARRSPSAGRAALRRRPPAPPWRRAVHLGAGDRRPLRRRPARRGDDVAGRRSRGGTAAAAPRVAVAWRGALFADGCAGRRCEQRRSSSPAPPSGADEWIASLDDAGRIRELLSPAADPAPSDRLLARLTRLAARAADVLGGPQDLEWTADDDDRVGLVRIRPIVRLRATPRLLRPSRRPRRKAGRASARVSAGTAPVHRTHPGARPAHRVASGPQRRVGRAERLIALQRRAVDPDAAVIGP